MAHTSRHVERADSVYNINEPLSTCLGSRGAASLDRLRYAFDGIVGLHPRLVAQRERVLLYVSGSGTVSWLTKDRPGNGASELLAFA